MITVLSAMGFVFLSLLAIIGLLVGVGLNFLHLVTPQEQIKERVLLDAAWLGLGTSLAFAQLWHFFRPVDGMVLSILVVLSLFGYISTRKKLKHYTFTLTFGLPVCFSLLLLTGFTIFLTNKSIGTVTISDSSLYHWLSMLWNHAYAVVPGLGNLHSRLAFNSSYFLYPAILNAGIWADRVNHISNGSVFFLFSLEVFFSLYRMFTQAEKGDVADMLLLVSSMFLMTQSVVIPLLDNDQPVFLLQLIVVSKYFYLLEHQDLSDTDRRYLLFFSIFLAMVTVTIKLSSIFFPFCVVLGMFGTLWLRHPELRTWQYWQRIIGFSAASLMLVILPWILRGYILSGYPMYPATIGQINVDWKIPEETAIAEANEIRIWGREPANPDALNNYQWIKPWITRNFQTIPVKNLGFYTLLFGGAVLYMIFRKTFRRRYLLEYIIYLWPGVVGILFWFFSVPDPRFGLASLVTFFGGLLALALKQSFNYNRWVVLLVALACMTCGTLMRYNIRTTLLVTPGADHGLYILPDIELSTRETSSGLTVFIPENTNNSCYVELVCTPETRFSANLRLRDPDAGLQAGFTVQPTE